MSQREIASGAEQAYQPPIAVDNIMVRVEPDTLQIVGVEILEFFSDFLPNNRLFEESIRLREKYDGR